MAGLGRDDRPKAYVRGQKVPVEFVAIVNADGTIGDGSGGGGGGGGGGGTAKRLPLPVYVNRSGNMDGGVTNPDNSYTTPVARKVLDANADRVAGGTLINLGPQDGDLLWCKWIVNPGDVAVAPVPNPQAANGFDYDPGSFYLMPGDVLQIDTQQGLSMVSAGARIPYSLYEAVEAEVV